MDRLRVLLLRVWTLQVPSTMGTRIKARGTKHALQAALVLIFLGSTMPLHADDWIGGDLTICNHGTITVEMIAAVKVNNIFGNFWQIHGTTIAPHDCMSVTNQYGTPSYIAFGFTDSKGEWVSGRMAQVPDVGSVDSLFHKPQKILAGATTAMCAQKDAARYSIDDLSVDCARLQVDSIDTGHGPFLPLTAALYFQPDAQQCVDTYVASTSCEDSWTHYYLNIFPSATDRELHATQVTKSGADVPESSGESGESTMQFLAKLAKAVIDAADADSKARAQAKLDAEEAQLKHAREQQEARELRDKKVLAADAAGDPNAKVAAQMVRREQEDNRLRWANTPQSPAAYDPKWKGQNVAIVGTVSRVEVDPNGSPQWMTIYFKESPDATFVVCSPYPDMFQERVGLDLNTLVGKTIEAAGQVESPYCGGNAPKGSIRVVESTQWKIH